MDVHILGNFKFYYKHEVDARIEKSKTEIAKLQKFADGVWSGAYRGADARRVYKQMGLDNLTKEK